MKKDTLKVVFVALTLDDVDGGIARSVPELANAVHRAGANVTLMYPDFGRELAVDLTNSPVNICPLKFSMLNHNPALNFFGATKKLRELLQGGIDIVHHGGVWTALNLSVSRYCRKNNIPYVCSPRGSLDKWSMNYKKWRKRACWNLYAKRDVQSSLFIHATSDKEKRDLSILSAGNPIEVIPNGISATDFQVPKHIDSKGKAKKTLLFLSRIHPKKGLVNLLNAWSESSTNGWRLYIAGPSEGNHMNQLRKLAEKLNLGNVEFHGEVKESEKWKLYFSVDAFVLPSFTENFGLVVGEALSCGLPVLTTTGTPWDRLEKERCGWLVEPTVSSLTEGIRLLISTSTKDLQQMGANGSKFIKDHYCWDKCGIDLLAAYRRHLGISET